MITMASLPHQDYQSSKLRVQRRNQFFSGLLTYSFLSVMAVIIIIPFYWMLNVSFQTL